MRCSLLQLFLSHFIQMIDFTSHHKNEAFSGENVPLSTLFSSYNHKLSFRSSASIIWQQLCWVLKVYDICPEGIQPCNMKNWDIYWRRYKIEETSYIGRHLNPLQSGHLGTSHSCPNGHQLALLYFPEFYWWSEISSLSKVISVLGKARSCRAPNQGCWGGLVT